MLDQYIPVVVMFVLAAVIVAVMVSIGRILGPRNLTDVKATTFECGNDPSGSAWGRFSVKFYMTALLFIIFDVEVVFMYPWAIRLREFGWFGLWAMAPFLALLTFGLIYEWKKGALEWD